ncbi:MAG: DUF445 domain-containing protein [Candidatus Limimorpha sp.]
MSFEISYIVAPLLGGIIGYITNDIAIRMLFRPHKAKYLFGIKIPFTPGIIPKEKGRIASAIGGAISENLMSKDVLEKYLLSDKMITKIRLSIDSFFETQKNNQETVREFLAHYMTANDIDSLIRGLKEGLIEQVSTKLGESNLGEQISEVVMEHVSSKLRIDGLDLDIPQMLKSMIGSSVWGQVANLIEKPAKHYLAKNINQMLSANGPEIVGKLVDNGVDDISKLTMQKLLQGKDLQIAQATNTCIGLYRTIISEHLPRILEAINIPVIIESRINEMDMNETEKLIFQVMDKELKAIVWLGALLGLFMGSLNILL